MASFYKKLAAIVGIILALHIASNGEETSSFGGSLLCDSNTGVTCTSDASCVTTCKQRAGQYYVYAYCSPSPELNNVMGGGGGDGGDRSCMCTERCRVQSTPAQLEKLAIPTPAWRGMGTLD